MFELGKFLWSWANPTSLLFLALCLGTLLLFTRVMRLGRALVALAVLVAILIGIVPLDSYLLRTLEQRFPRPGSLPATIHGIVLLGGEVDQYRTLAEEEPVFRSRPNRVMAFSQLARRYPDARLVFTGGAAETGEDAIPEAHAMPTVLRAIGIDPARVVFEDRSRNTHENAIYTKDIIFPSAGENWLLVTSAAHMPRAMGCFRNAGWTVIPYPVDYVGRPPRWRWWPQNLEGGTVRLTAASREFVGLTVYWLLGYTDTWFPAP